MLRVDLTVPASWEELTQPQLRELLETIVDVQQRNRNVGFRDAEDYAAQVAAQVSTHLLFEWTPLEPICPYGNGYLVRHLDDEFELSAELLASAIAPLSWSKDLPKSPVRLDVVDGAKAVAADLSDGFQFDSWLACENNWQAYQLTQEDEWLHRMAAILYSKESIQLSPAEALGVFYWWAGLKAMVTEMFPYFFKPAGDGEGSEVTVESMRRNMDAQIRALTKGDITKEREILSMDALRALTELDAQAREYDELNRKYPHK